jgi:hypothetical protein
MFANLPSRSESPTPGEIILWWERRRIPYNVAVGAVGFVSVSILLSLGRSLVGDQEALFSPFLLFVGILLYGIAANLCYTLGWFTELALCKFGNSDTTKFATSAFNTGLALSCVVTSLPLWFVLTLWVSHSR